MKYRIATLARHGFTLLELLVVLLIIALLAGYVGPKLFDKVGKAKSQTAKGQMKLIADSLDHYRLDNNRYPTTEQGLVALITRPTDTPKWQGPYLAKDLPADPWDRPYVYKSPGDTRDFDLLSYGADGRAGGTGEDADLSYWQP